MRIIISGLLKLPCSNPSGAPTARLCLLAVALCFVSSTRLPARAAESFAKITPPVSIRPLPVTGNGDNRKAGLEVTNNSDKTISRLTVQVYLFNQDGGVAGRVPHTSDGFFGDAGGGLGEGRQFVINLSSFWVKDHITSVAGVVNGLTWEDGAKWPAWTGPAPQQEGDTPVSLVMKGIVTEGDPGLPLIECFNHSSREIRGIKYRVRYLDGEENELFRKRWGVNGLRLEPGKGVALVGFEGPPTSAVDVKLSLLDVTFADSPGAATHSALTAGQIGNRKNVSGGNWTVSFEEERHLGFVVIGTSEDGEHTREFHWSARPSRSHNFHFSHHAVGKDHEVTFSPARGKADGKSGGAESACRFRNPEFGYSQEFVDCDLQFRSAGPRVGRSLRGPITLYSLKSFGGKPVFVLKIVFAKDPAPAEEALNRALDRLYRRQRPPAPQEGR